MIKATKQLFTSPDYFPISTHKATCLNPYTLLNIHSTELQGRDAQPQTFVDLLGGIPFRTLIVFRFAKREFASPEPMSTCLFPLVRAVIAHCLSMI